MKKVVIISRSGNVKTEQIKNCTVEKLYKKCKFRKNTNFELRHTWKCKDQFVSLYARDEGRANTENKYEMPPPLDKVLYFSNMILVKHTEKSIKNKELLNFTKEEWLVLYEKLMGGFAVVSFVALIEIVANLLYATHDHLL